MDRPISTHRTLWLPVLGALGLILISCQLFTPTNTSPGADTPPSGTSISLATQSTQTNTGNVLLADPVTGLSGLQSYHVIYDQVIDGSLDGQPYQRHTHIEHSVVVSAGDEEVFKEVTSADSSAFLHSVRLGGADYTQQQENFPCQGSPTDTTLGSFTPEASLLLPVNAANLVGDETVNGIAAKHYRFDGGGLPVEDQTIAASGEMWIATGGGYVVKYSLSIPAPANPSGTGLEAGQALSYELSQVNAVPAIQLPEGCSPVPVNLPMLSDAATVALGSGYLDYTTASDADQVISFYSQKLPELGWQIEGNAPAGGLGLPVFLTYTQGDQSLSITVDSVEGGGLEVSCTLSVMTAIKSGPTPTPGPAVTSGPQPTANPADSGLPADVPLYPGATNLQNLGGTVMFNSTDGVDKVAGYYRDQLKANGWTLGNDMTVQGQVIMSWSKGQNSLQVVVMDQDGKTMVVITGG